MSGNRTPLLMSVQAGMASGATVAVALRWYTRVCISNNIGLDDWFMLAALFFSWGCSGPGLVSAIYGMGRHMEDLPPGDIPKAIMWVWVARMSTIVSFCFCKLSIAWMLLRISSIRRKYRYILYSSMVVNICVSIIWLIMTIRCVPANANWLGQREGDKCIPNVVTVNHAYFAGAAHSALDLLYAVIPIFIVWDLKLSTRTRIGLACLLSLGAFACACSIKKITETARLGAARDITWEFTDLSIWNMVEFNVGIICGSIPCIRPLFQRIFHASRTLVTSSGGAAGSASGGLGKSGGARSGYGKMGYGNGYAPHSPYAEKHGRAGLSNPSSHGDDGYELDDMKYGGGGTPGAGNGKVTTRIRAGRGGDNSSEENILPMQGSIVQTTEVEVRYDGASAAEDNRSGRMSGMSNNGKGWGEAR